MTLIYTLRYLQSTDNTPVGRVHALEDLQMTHPKRAVGGFTQNVLPKFWGEKNNQKSKKKFLDGSGFTGLKA